MLRRVCIVLVVLVATFTQSGCILNIWDSDPNIRMQQMLNVSEDLRQIRGEWHRFWMTDQPSHLTPVRVHGGVGPGLIGP